MKDGDLYVGGYSYDTQSGFYERHGVGRSIDPDTGIACEENEWCYGKEVEKREKTVQKGWYVSNNLDNNSLRVVVGVERANTAPSDTGAHYHPVVKIDVSNIPAVKYTVNNRNTFFSIPSNVTHLTVNSNCCNDYDITSFDIHDRVNYAVEKSSLILNRSARTISLILSIDTSICAVMDYFEIFLTRMMLSKRAAEYLDLSFKLEINGTQFL